MTPQPPVPPRTLRRYALAVDAVCAAILAGLAMTLAAGIGVVGFGALLVLLVALLSVGLEVALGRLRRRP